MTSKNNTIGFIIKSFREAYNLTQANLASKIGVSQRNVSYYESGERIPPADILKKIATLFDISVDELIGIKKIGSNGNCDSFFYEEGLANWSIRKKSEELGLSYQEVLDKTRIDGARLKLLWYGNMQPFAEELIRFSEVLNVSIDYLLDNSQREKISAEEEIILMYYKKHPEEIMDLLSSFISLTKKNRTIVSGKCFELEQDEAVAADEPLHKTGTDNLGK